MVASSSSPENQACFFFGGIGDARHLYATLISIARSEQASSRPSDRKYHFTVNDIKAETLARNLLFFILLQDVSEIDDPTSEESTFNLTTIFFLYSDQIIPPYVFSHLQRIIIRAISALSSPSELPTWIYINEGDKALLIDVLVSWQGRALQLYSTADVLALSVKRESNATDALFGLTSMLGPEGDAAPKGCEGEQASYLETGMLYPPDTLLRKHESSLKKSIINFERSRGSTQAKKIQDYLNSEWKVNVTLLDIHFVRQQEHELDMTLEPFNLTDHFYAQSGLEKPSIQNVCMIMWPRSFSRLQKRSNNSMAGSLSKRSVMRLLRLRNRYDMNV